MRMLNDQDRYYLAAIKRMLEADAAKLKCGPTLHSEALHDNIEWLDTILFNPNRNPGGRVS